MYRCTMCHQEKPDAITVDGLPADYALCDDCCERLFNVMEERVGLRKAEEELPLD